MISRQNIHRLSPSPPRVEIRPESRRQPGRRCAERGWCEKQCSKTFEEATPLLDQTFADVRKSEDVAERLLCCPSRRVPGGVVNRQGPEELKLEWKFHSGKQILNSSWRLRLETTIFQSSRWGTFTTPSTLVQPGTALRSEAERACLT